MRGYSAALENPLVVEHFELFDKRQEMRILAMNECLLAHFGERTNMYSPCDDRTASPRHVLANKVVLLYFSASWCVPCRHFTPKLIEWYRDCRDQPQTEEFEVVFCSSDIMPCLYEEYTAKMPWWCIPFQSSSVVQKLASIYRTTGVPHLVVLDKDGSVLHHDAVPLVLRHYHHSNNVTSTATATSTTTSSTFPWRPKRIVDLLPRQYWKADGTSAPLETLDGKNVMLYVSASWCPPCQRLTPQVAALYRALTLERKHRDFEFLYVSNDRSLDEFQTAHRSMGFGAIPFEERQAVTEIMSLLGIHYLPTLLMFGPKSANLNCDRPLLNANVCDIFQQQSPLALSPDSLTAKFPFAPPTFGDLNRISEDIHKTKCVVIFCEACDDEEQEEIKELLQSASRAYKGCGSPRFYYATESTELTKALRETLSLGPPNCTKQCMILLDIPTSGSFYVAPCTREIRVESILHFVQEPGERHVL